MCDLIGCGVCFITAHSKYKSSQWLPVNMYFIKEIENLSAVLCAVIKHLDICPCMLYNCTQNVDAFSISSLYIII
jgi:hypothetical protein